MLQHRYTLDEGSGSTAYDSAGNANGTLNGPHLDNRPQRLSPEL